MSKYKIMENGLKNGTMESSKANTAPISFYLQQVNRIRESYLPEDYLFERAIQAKKFIDDNYSDKIALDVIAARACLSKFHFIRLFKTVYGRTPHQYLIGVRIEKAKQILKTHASVTEACFAVGFDSVTSFTALFRKITGNKPSDFKKKHRKLNQ